MTETIFSIAASGDDARADVSQVGTSWPPTDTPIVTTAADELVVVKFRSSTAMQVSVCFLRFDTSSIPDRDTITAAVLRVFVQQQTQTSSRFLNLEWYDPGAFDTSDWAVDIPATAGCYFLNESVTGSLDIPLINVSQISRTGLTALRLGISGGAPVPVVAGDDGGVFLVSSFDHATDPEPRLVVTHMPPVLQQPLVARSYGSVRS